MLYEKILHDLKYYDHVDTPEIVNFVDVLRIATEKVSTNELNVQEYLTILRELSKMTIYVAKEIEFNYTKQLNIIVNMTIEILEKRNPSGADH